MCDMLIPHGGLELLAYSCEALLYLCIGLCLEGIWDTSLAMWADSLCKILIGRWVVLFCLLLCSLTHWLMVCLSGFEPVPGCTTGDVRDGGMGFSWMSDLGTFHCKVRLVISLSVRQTQTDRLTKAH